MFSLKETYDFISSFKKVVDSHMYKVISLNIKDVVENLLLL